MMTRLIPSFQPTLLSFLLLLTSLLSPTIAESYSASPTASPSVSPSIASNSSSYPSPSPSPALRIVDGDGDGRMYRYAGCWNETFGLPGTLDVRALRGANQVLTGTMTVGRCLDFCARGGNGQGSVAAFRFAGLEFSRECWCGDALNFASIPLPDDACNTPCDGANDTACGGALRLSLYNSTDAATWTDAKENAAAGSKWEGAWRGGGMAAVGSTVLLLGIALAGL